VTPIFYKLQRYEAAAATPADNAVPAPQSETAPTAQ